MANHQERSECRQRLLNALSTWEMAEFAIDPEDLGPVDDQGWKGQCLVIPKLWDDDDLKYPALGFLLGGV